MDNKEALHTLNNIREMMEKSTRFLTLSGTSAIIIGIYACIAAFVSYFIIGGNFQPFPNPRFISALQINPVEKMTLILIFAGILIGLSLFTGTYMSIRKARKNNQTLQFDHTAKRFLWNFFFPLIVGGILCLSLISQQHYGLTSSIMLIFYGIALVNASNYTYSHTRYLGYAEIFLGLVDSFVGNYALLFWTIGFGLLHIIYGILFHLKYDK